MLRYVSRNVEVFTMKKCRSYSLLQRSLSLLLSLSMALSVVAEIDLLAFFAFAGSVSAESALSASDPDEYAKETLEYMWDSDGDKIPDNNFLSASRPYYACRNGSFGGVEYRTIFHVYAFEGDTICLGSSVYNSTLNINHKENTYDSATKGEKGSVDIVMTDLSGNTHAIDIRNSSDEGGETNTTGYIPNWQTEYAAVKYLEKKDGKFSGTYNDGITSYTYTPYTYTVTETGVYTFEFHSYNKSNDLNDVSGHRKRSEPFHDPTTNYGGEIAAINLTVFDESGKEQHGRTYADFLSMQMHPDSTGIVDTYYILTKDSYIYKIKFNNASPYTYNFFSNNKGIYDPDSTNGDIIYKSVKDINNDNTFGEMGVEFRYPGTKDTDMLKSYYIFLEYPDDQLEGRLYEKAVQPDPATNLSFVSTIKDDDGNTIPGAYTGQGGYFVFDVEEATTATLRLEFTGMKDKYAPVEISKAVTPHSRNYFFWNGKDGNGVVIPQGEYDLDDIAFTVTTKAGEIHFPIIDMETASGGITFTRMSHIYDKEGNQLDSKLTETKNIYDYTRNVIYYDDTAIYYGEKITPTAAFSESEVDVAKKASFFETNPGKYWEYTNVRSNNGEYQARLYLVGQDYISSISDDSKIRVGDHSHTTNIIDYFDGDQLIGTPTDEQKKIIHYLDSKELPVGKTTSTATYSSTTDYGIANFWTFVPAKPATSTATTQQITIKDPGDYSFELTGRVFFDADKDGIYDSMSSDGDYMLKDVTLNLYKKSSDSTYDSNKKYVAYDAATKSLTEVNASNFSISNLYELVDTAQTTGDGSYKFTGLNYDSAAGTEYIYEVKSPGSNYDLTSNNKTAAPSKTSEKNPSENRPYGYYADKSYGTTYKGTEVQHIVVGGSDGVDPTKITCTGAENPTHTVCAVDVGYYYKTLDQTLEFKKVWDEPTEKHPDAVAYKVCYKLAKSTTVKTYAYPVLSAINSWQYTYTYPHSVDENGKNAIDNYYVDSEYYIDGEYIYKHTFVYDHSTGKYKTFVGESYRASLTSLNEIVDEWNTSNGITGTADVKAFSNIPDLSLLDDEDLIWAPLGENDSPYKAVIDRNFGSDTISVTITNAKEHGTIEIFKYHETADEANALQGATFRVYELPSGMTVENGLTHIKTLVEENNISELNKLQVGSDTTRSNGRIAFPGLDSTKNYVVREMHAPVGYRILNEFYVVKAKGGGSLTPEEEDSGIYSVFDSNNYALLKIGNAPADGEFYIRKQIEGRSWLPAGDGIAEDSFTFTILNAFEENDTSDSSFSIYSTDSKGVQVDIKEADILGASFDILGRVETFASNFYEIVTTPPATPAPNKITVTNESPFYSYSEEDRFGDTHYYTYPDQKRSDALLVRGDESTSASFCGVEFPVAGTYTFTISEDDIEIYGDDTLTKSTLEYTVKITVTRKLESTALEGAVMTEDNSYLFAEISSITYRDTTDSLSLSQVFAGSSPLFTNKYAPAPAKQSTTYAIKKELTGRNWSASDEFTVRVSGIDTTTQEAITNKNLVINGEKAGDFALAAGASEWVHQFTQTNQGDWKFGSFTFKDIVFPVQYVNIADPNDIKDTLDEDDDPSKYEAQTLPVTYWLKIKEDIPTGATGNVLDGIAYDDTVYYLEIILRNTEVGNEGTDSEEEDGIIDEMDLNLYTGSDQSTVPDTAKLTLVADCKTVQTVVTEDEWNNLRATTTPSTEGEYDKSTSVSKLCIYNDTIYDNIPSGADESKCIFIKKEETHLSKKGTSGHTMVITNEYSTTYEWTPQIQKNLTGRKWRTNDEFTFTLTCTDAPDGVDPESFNQSPISITKDTEDYKAYFETIKFTVPGTYTFVIKEKSKGNGMTTTVKDTESGEYTVTVTFKDMGDGKLSPTINGEQTGPATLIVFNNVYADKDESFDLAISKQIVGRDWNDKDEFTFMITPDPDTIAAIKDGYLDMSEIGPQNTDGSYTVTVKMADAIPGTTVTDTVVKALGEILIKEVTEDKTQYKFTITENTPPDNMHCLESSIDLYVNVTRKLDSNLPTGDLEVSATYAYTATTDESTKKLFDKDTVNPTATIPFVNLCMGELTVEKKVVSSTGSNQPFDFEVQFTFKDGAYTEKMKAVHSSTSASVDVSSDGNTRTYKFQLKDEENVTFTNIPPYTKYTVSEIGTMPTGYMFLRVEDRGGTILNSKETSMSGEINGESDEQYLLFVNGEIKELPSAGGSGTGTFVVLGAAIMAVASVMLIAVWYISRKKTGRAEQRS